MLIPFGARFTGGNERRTFGEASAAARSATYVRHLIYMRIKGEDVGDRKATLFGALALGTGLRDAWIDEHQGWAEILSDVYDSDTLGDTHLIRREANAFRRPHRLEQVVHELSDSRVRRRHRLGTLAQHG